MKIKRILLVFALAFAMFAIVGCTSDDPDFTGTYDAISVEGGSTPWGTAAFTSANVEDTTIMIKEDGTGMLTLEGVEYPITYTTEDAVITLTGEEGQEIKLVLEDRDLMYADNQVTIIFAKQQSHQDI